MARLRAFVPTLVLVTGAAIAAACSGGGDSGIDPNAVVNGGDGGGSSSGASSSSGAGSSSGGSSGASSSGGSSGSSGGDGGNDAGPPLIASTLSAGGTVACTLDGAGAMKCWGAGKSTSQSVGAGSTFSEVDVGDYQTCAIKSDKTLWCWTSSTFTPASKDTGLFKKVSAGNQHFCAINSVGKLYCWGNNYYGQLGTGDNTAQTGLTPVAAAKNWNVVSAGTGHTCALDDTNALYCWGYNASGEVGDNGGNSSDAAFAQQQSPVPIMAGTTWLDISAGGSATCGVASDRKLRCWGAQLGAANKVPTPVDTATDWAMVRVGSSHACAIKTTGALYCWGVNQWGQVGTGTVTNNVTTLQQVGSATDWAAVDVGGGFTCARKTSGAIYCFGTNANGELGAGLPSHLAPTKIGATAEWLYVMASNDITCGVKKTGSLHCWGGTNYIAGPDIRRQAPYQIGVDTNWSTVTAGTYHACARKNDNSLYCWGWNYNGVVGVGAEYTQYASPQSVGLSASAVSAGASHTCAIEAGTGLLWCWGDGSYGQLFASGDSLTPRKANGDFKFDKLATGYRDTCAVRGAGNDGGAPGDVYCAGLGLSGTYGEFQFAGATDISVNAGDEDYRAITGGKIKVFSWIDSPVDDGAEQNWKQVAAGANHRCAIRNDNTLACGGTNNFGQVGDGTTTTRSALTNIGVANDWQQVSVGSAHSCALRNGGELYCWGSNANGQIGDNTAWSVTPLAVVQ